MINGDENMHEYNYYTYNTRVEFFEKVNDEVF
jgi:hypothetical protein